MRVFLFRSSRVEVDAVAEPVCAATCGRGLMATFEEHL